jgi:hypothetical protein
MPASHARPSAACTTTSGTPPRFPREHAVQGWCPPIPMLRRLGFRTSFEIEEERQALKAIRGDYRNVQPGDGQSVLRAVRA